MENIDVLKIFAEYGPLGLMLFIFMVGMYLLFKHFKTDGERRDSSQKELIQIIAGKKDSEIDKLCIKIEKMIELIHGTQAQTTQLIVKLENDRSSTKDLISNLIEKMDRHDSRVCTNLQQQDKLISDMHGFVDRVYGTKIPIGQILINMGFVTQEQLDEALSMQKGWREK